MLSGKRAVRRRITGRFTTRSRQRVFKRPYLTNPSGFITAFGAVIGTYLPKGPNMEIEMELVPLPVSEARKVGRPARRVYYVRHKAKRVGPFVRLGDAKIAIHRAQRAIERSNLASGVQ